MTWWDMSYWIGTAILCHCIFSHSDIILHYTYYLLMLYLFHASYIRINRADKKIKSCQGRLQPLCISLFAWRGVNCCPFWTFYFEIIEGETVSPSLYHDVSTNGPLTTKISIFLLTLLHVVNDLHRSNPAKGGCSTSVYHYLINEGFIAAHFWSF